MKKFLLLSTLFVAATTTMNAALPQPVVSALPSQIDWFDGFGVVWSESRTQPYTLEIVDASGITVTKNLVEDVEILDVALTEYQASYDDPNIENAQLVVTLAGFETEVGATYTLNIPAGAVLVNTGASEELNDAVEYSFQLKSSEGEVVLPEPEIVPAPGLVGGLTTIEMSWMGVLGSLDLLNAVNNIDEDANIDPVALYAGEELLSYPEVSFKWQKRLDTTDGAAGNVLVLTLSEDESLEEGTYTVLIPAGYLQISDIETGTLYNDEIVLGYKVDFTAAGVKSILLDSVSGGVYNLNGVKVGTSLENLPKGLYIVGGKKVVK